MGQATVPRLLAAGFEVAVAHSGAHEPAGLSQVEHLRGSREELLGVGGAVERWRPEVRVDTFAGGATAAKARGLGDVAARCDAQQVVAISSVDVYRHCALAGVDGHEPADLPLDPLRSARGWTPAACRRASASRAPTRWIATAAQIAWLWERREELLSRPSS
ncbi:MAG: hypothetical protein QOF29_2886 [bacterium]